MSYYWTENDPPFSFVPENWTFEQKKKFRYECIDYLPGAINFPRFAGKRVLCIGDGSGIDAVEFARAGATVSVVDLSEKAIELTRKHFREVGIEDRVLHVGDVSREIAWKDESFDVVYSFGVLHHIVDVGHAVYEISRVLKPGGLFLGMVYHRDSLLYAYSILLRAMREGLTADEAMRKYSERNEGCPHSRVYSRDELQALLAPRFSTICTEIYYPVIDLPEKRKVKVDAPKDIGWHLFFEATK